MSYSRGSSPLLKENRKSASDADCSLVLQHHFHPEIYIDQAFSQIKKIIYKVPVTLINRPSIQRIRSIIWKREGGRKNLKIETLLQIAYFFGVSPSVLLTSRDLESQIKIGDLRSRSYLPSENIQVLLKLISRHLQSQIRQFQFEFAEDLDMDGDKLSLLELAKIMQVSNITLQEIMSMHVVPLYLQFMRVLQVGMDPIDFFKEVESLEDFNTNFYINRGNSSSNSEPTKEQRQASTSVNHHILEAMASRGIRSSFAIYNLIRNSKRALQSDQANILFSTLVRVSYITRYSVTDIVNGRISHNNSDLPKVRTQRNSHRDNYISKAKKVLVYMIKHEMRHQELSDQDLLVRSGISDKPRFLKNDNSNIRYSNLLQIVEFGLGMPLSDFMEGQNSTGLSLEDLIEQFDTIDFDVQAPPSRDDVFNGYLEDLGHRILILYGLLEASRLGSVSIKTLTGFKLDFYKNGKLPDKRMTIAALLRLTYLFNMSLLQFLTMNYEDLSSLEVVNRERLPDTTIQNALNTLSNNIQRDMHTLGLSLNDMRIKVDPINTRPRYLEPIFNGHLTASYYRFVQVCKALTRPDEDIFFVMQRLLEGVSIFI